MVLYGAGGAATTIPNALLSAILIKVGLDIVDWRFLLRAHRLSAKTASVMWGVLLLTVFWNLIGAVLVGVFVANLFKQCILFQHIFNDSKLKNNIIGSFDRIKQYHPDTIRYYYRKYYHSKNMIISISGHITPELKKQTLQQLVDLVWLKVWQIKFIHQSFLRIQILILPTKLKKSYLQIIIIYQHPKM